MLVPGNLGFRVAAFFIFLVFPTTGFIIRRKWRLAVARKQEINRLLILASEEAARAELEATIDYTAAVPAPLYRQCSVCFIPASNHCARCKSVYYWYVVCYSICNFCSICYIIWISIFGPNLTGRNHEIKTV